MKKTLLFFSAIILFGLIGCSDKIDKINQKMPKDFNFSLTYGTYGKQQIDTFNNIVVKDLVRDGTIEAKISLTEQEMKKIYSKMIEINIMGDLDFQEDKECEVEPPSSSRWNIQMDSRTKSIDYKTYCDYPQDVLNLLELEDYILSIVTEKDGYEKLPEANGYYE